MSQRNVTVRLSVQANTQGVDSYKDAIKGAKEETDGLKTASTQSQPAVSGLSTLVGGLAASAVAFKLADMAGQLNSLGQEASANEEIFTALTGEMGNMEEIMGRLREATMGQASDNQIMSGANMLMRLGLANSPEELEGTLSLITRLKKPTEDLGSAIENWSLMMSNQSALRLDSWGISAAAVRERIDELLESGEALNYSDAFNMATVQIGTESLVDLGEAATVADTNLGRLGTRFQNVKEDAGQALNAVLEFAGGVADSAWQTAETIGAIGEAQAQLAEIEDAQFSADAIATIDTAAIAGQLEGMDRAFAEAFAKRTYEVSTRFTGLEGENLLDETLQSLASDPERGLSFDLPENLDLLRPALLDLQELAVVQADHNRAAEEAARVEAEQAAAMEEANAARQMGLDLMRKQEEAEQRRLQSAGMVAEMDAMNATAIQVAFENMAAFSSMDALPEFMTQDQADRLQAMADDAAAMYEEMSHLDELNPEMFSDHEIENAKATADEVKRLADDAQKAADAFADIKLSEVFGQTGGGVVGEIGDMVIEAAKGRGATDEEIEALQRAMDLESGRATAGSLFLAEDLTPIVADIAAQQGPEVAAGVSRALAEALATAALQGIDTNSPEFMDALKNTMLENAEGFDPTAFVDDFGSEEEGDGEGLEAASTTTAENMSSMAADTTITAENMEPIKTGFDEMATSSERMSGAVEGVVGDFDTLAKKITNVKNDLAIISGKQYKFVFDIEAIGNGVPVIDFFNRTGVSATLQREIGDNGGVVPGTNTNVGLS